MDPVSQPTPNEGDAMTPQDVQALEAFLNQLIQARVDGRDPQAAAMIAEAAARQPDAAYLLVQRAMLLGRALENAQAQIQSLQSQLQAAQASGSRGFMNDDSAWGASAGRAPQGGMPSAAPAPMPGSQYQAAPAQNPTAPTQYPSAPTQPSRPGFLSGGLGGTLGSIATTAAGVAGGALLFQGIENLFHRGNSGSGFLDPSAAGSRPTETTVVNNYYGDDKGSGAGNANLLADNGNLDNGLDDLINDDYRDDDSSVF